MGNLFSASHNKCEEPVFLKSTNNVCDVNAQGAFSAFLLGKSTKLSDDSDEAYNPKCILPKDLQLYSWSDHKWHSLGEDTWTWSDCAKVAKKLAVKKKSDDSDSDAPTLGNMQQYVFDAKRAHENRDHLKKDAKGKPIILISLICTTVNMDNWLEDQKVDPLNLKRVKLTVKEICTPRNRDRVRMYTRMYCKKKGGSMLSSSSTEVACHTAFVQIDHNVRHTHYGVTGCNVTAWNRETGIVKEATFKNADAMDALVKKINEASKSAKGTLDCTALECICHELDQTIENSKTKEILKPDTANADKFVVLVGEAKCGAAKVRVQLMSSLNDDVQAKIKECKAEVPSSVAEGSRVSDCQGSIIKHASAIYLGTFDFHKSTKGVNVTPYE